MFSKKTHILKSDSSSLHYAIIPWDSEYLHNTTIEIENFTVTSLAILKKLITLLKKTHKLKRGDLIVSKIPLAEYPKVHMLDQIGFYFVEQSITLDIDLSSWNPHAFIFPNDSKYRLIPAGASDQKAIQDIARTTFIADRFHLDARIPKLRADYRFEMWIENSFHSSDSIYKFIDNKNRIVGFYIFRKYPELVDLRLAGLNPLYIGKGLGKMMYHHIYQLLKEKKCTKAKATISLNNSPVLNLYVYLSQVKFAHPLIILHNVL